MEFCSLNASATFGNKVGVTTGHCSNPDRNVRWLRAFFGGGRIDGASRFQAFLRVVMPLSSPGIIATAIYSFVQSWNEYIYAVTFLTSKEKLTLPVGLQQFFTEYATDWPGLMAAAFIMSVPVVAIFLVLQRYFVRALAEGAVKS